MFLETDCQLPVECWIAPWLACCLLISLFWANLRHSCRRGTGESLDSVFALGDGHDRDTGYFANSPLEITIVCCDWSQNGAVWDMKKRERTSSDVDTVLLDAVDDALSPLVYDSHTSIRMQD